MARRAFLDAFALRMRVVLEDLHVIEILARWNIAQRIGRPRHPGMFWVQRMDVADEAVAITALEHDCGQSRGGDGEELAPCVFNQSVFGHLSFQQIYFTG